MTKEIWDKVKWWLALAITAGLVALGVNAMIRGADAEDRQIYNDAVERVTKICGPEVGAKFRIAYSPDLAYTGDAASDSYKWVQRCVVGR